MTFDEATEKIKSMASNHQGKFGAKANFQFDEGIIHLDDTTDPTTVATEELPADCTFRMSLDNLEKIMSGDLNPMMAFMTGKLKIDGDKGVAMKLSSLF